LSKKAKDVPFECFKQLLHLLTQQCNRKTRRGLGIPTELLIVDSTQITVGLGRLPWAPLKGEKAGVKLHVALTGDEGALHQVTETLGTEHDIHSAADFVDPRFILVADRAYSKHEVFDRYQEAKNSQSFVIRIRENTHFHDPVPRERKTSFGGTITQDLTCQLGRLKSLTRNRFRVVVLTDPKGKPVLLATNLHWHSAESIAEIYKKRWQIEVFFRWIKQHLN
ncbi:IS4 family transposase, partial [Paenibacillus agri]